MRPTRTAYRLVDSLHDYRRCHRLLQAQGVEDHGLSWPTVMAIREGLAVGCLGTMPGKDAIIAGNLAVITRHPLITITRLIDAYEVVLRAAHVTSYEFGIELPTHAAWCGLILRSGLVPYHHDEHSAWFHKYVSEG